MIGTYNVLEAALATQDTLERLVEFSTSEVFGQHAFNVQEGQVTTIGSVGEARWTYAVSKLAGEHMAHAYHAELGLPTRLGAPVQRLRPGPDRRRRDPRVHRGRARRARPDDPRRRLADPRVVLRRRHGRRRCCSRSSTRTRSARASTSATRARRSRSTTSRSGSSGSPAARARSSSSRSTTSTSSCASRTSSKARELLGFEAKVELDEGLERTIAWYREHSAGGRERADPARAPGRRRGRARRGRRGASRAGS